MKQSLRDSTLSIAYRQILPVYNRHLVHHDHPETAHLCILVSRNSLLLELLNVLVQKPRPKFGKPVDQHVQLLKLVAEEVLDERGRNVQFLLVLLKRAAIVIKSAFAG